MAVEVVRHTYVSKNDPECWLILFAQVFLLYQKISCRLKKLWYSAPLNIAHSLRNNEIMTFFAQVIIKCIYRVHTYNFLRCNVCFGVNCMGFEEGWTASHKQYNSVNHWNLKKRKKSLLMESGILGFGIPNTAQGIRNPSYVWKFY